ncbi:Ig-like domain-containing protein, partial [Algoriphagus aquatilis]
MFNWSSLNKLIGFVFIFCSSSSFLFSQTTVSPIFFYPSYGYPGSSLKLFGSGLTLDMEVRIGDSAPCQISNVTSDQTTLTITLPNDFGTDKVKVYSNGILIFESLGDLAALSGPPFVSSPVEDPSNPYVEIHYGDPYSYTVITDFLGNLEPNLSPQIIPSWLNFYTNIERVVNGQTIKYKNYNPVSFGDFGNNLIGGVAEDPFGNVYVSNSTGSEIFKVNYHTGDTFLWRTGLIPPSGSSIYSLYVSENFLFIPRQSAGSGSVTRIELSDPNKTLNPFVNISGGIYSIFQYAGRYYMPNYGSGRVIVRQGTTSSVFLSGLALNGPTSVSIDENSSTFFLGTGQRGGINSFDLKNTSIPSNRIYFSSFSDKWVEGLNRNSRGDFFIAQRNGGLVRFKSSDNTVIQISDTDTENVRSISNSGRGSVIYSNFETNKLFKLQNWGLLEGTPQKSDLGIHRVLLKSSSDAGVEYQEFFIRVVDRIPPELIQVSPAHQSIHVPVGTSLKLTFDEEIQLGTGGRLAIYSGTSPDPIQIFDLSNTEDRSNLSISSDLISLNVTLKENLPYDAKITVAVINDENGNFIEDLSNNAFRGFSFESEYWYFQTQRQLIITANSDTKTYDGSTLTNPGYSLSSGVLFDGESLVSVTVTGSQTVVGESANVASVAVIKDSSNNDVTSNYQISYVAGTLEVTTRAIEITAASDEKVYDGTALTDSGSEITTGSLVAGHTYTATVTGSQTVVGESANVASVAVIKDSSNNDVTSNYQISYVAGTLE